MAVFQTNQVRQFYVAKTVSSSAVTNSSDAGTIRLVKDTSGNNVAKEQVYFEVKGYDTVLRSDIINPKNVIAVNAVSADASSQKIPLKSYKITLNADVLAANSGNVVAGEDYIMRITISPFVGMADTTSYTKFGAVHAHIGMTVSNFYKALALSVVKNFSRELVKLIDVKLVESKTGENDKVVTVTPAGPATALTSGYAYSGIIINEVEQEWTLGLKQQEQGYLKNASFSFSKIKLGGDDVDWAVVTPDNGANAMAPAGLLFNGKKIADLEYFCQGERGDQYKMRGWPNCFPFNPLVDPSKKYDIITIHYAFTDSNEGVQKSEKDMQIVIPLDTTSTSHTTTTSLLTAINNALGTNAALVTA